MHAAQDLGNLITLIDYNGSIVKNYRLINYYFQAVEKIDEHNVLLLNNTASKTDPWFIGKYNLDKEFITQRFIPSEQSKYPLLSFTMNNNFMSFENRLFFAYSSIFGIYEYKENKFQKILSYDLGEREVPKNFQKEFEKGRRMAVFRDEAKRNGYVPYLKSTFFFKNYNLVILDDNKFSCYAISDNLKNVYLNGTIPEYFDLPNVRSLRNPVEVDSAFITFSCEPLDFFEANEVDADKQIQIGEHTIKLNYNSNPFLVIVK